MTSLRSAGVDARSNLSAGRVSQRRRGLGGSGLHRDRAGRGARHRGGQRRAGRGVRRRRRGGRGGLALPAARRERPAGHAALGHFFKINRFECRNLLFECGKPKGVGLRPRLQLESVDS